MKAVTTVVGREQVLSLGKSALNSIIEALDCWLAAFGSEDATKGKVSGTLFQMWYLPCYYCVVISFTRLARI